MTLELNTYSFYPKVNKIFKGEKSKYDYICTAFEVCVRADEMNNKNVSEYSIVILTYLFLDYYEGKTNVNFDIAMQSDTGSTYDIYHFMKKVNGSRKKQFMNVKIANYDSLRLKLENRRDNFLGFNSIDDILKDFVNNEIKVKLGKFEEFLVSNEIGYNKKDIDELIDDVLSQSNLYLNHKALNGTFKIPSEMTDAIKSKLELDDLGNSLHSTGKNIKKVKV